MNDSNKLLLQQMLKYLPQVGIGIRKIASDTGVSSTTLYNIRNGLNVSSAKGQSILSQLICLYPNELEKIKIMIQIDSERERMEAQNELFG